MIDAGQSMIKSKKFWALLVIAAVGFVGYQKFEHRYEKDRRFHRRVDKKLKPIRDFWWILIKPIGADTSRMDQRHEQRIHAMGGSFNRLNQQERQMREMQEMQEGVAGSGMAGSGMAGGMGLGMPVETEEQREKREWNENYD